MGQLDYNEVCPRCQRKRVEHIAGMLCTDSFPVKVVDLEELPVILRPTELAAQLEAARQAARVAAFNEALREINYCCTIYSMEDICDGFKTELHERMMKLRSAAPLGDPPPGATP